MCKLGMEASFRSWIHHQRNNKVKITKNSEAEKLICKYYGILKERAVEFFKVVSQENFVKARASFDEIYKS